MIHQILLKIQRHSKFTDAVMLILAVFTATFFVYRDFGIRMIVGFGGLFLIMVLHSMRRLTHDRPATIRSVHLPLLALALVILLNFLRPDSRHDADSLSYIIAMLFSCGFLLLADPDAPEVRRTLKVLYWAGMFLAVFVVFFSVFDELFFSTLYHLLTPTAREYLDFFVPAGYAITLGGCTYTAYIIYIGMCVCCAEICASPRWTKRSTLMLLSYGLFLAALVLVGRRGELLGALVCSVLLVLVMCPRRRRRQLILAGVVALAAFIGLFIAFLPELKQISALQRYVVTLENLLQGNDITSGRSTLYQLALRAYREHPLVGIGWDQFYRLVPPDYLTDDVVLLEDVHCIYLQFLCETGTLSGLLIMAPLFYYYYVVCAQLKHLKHRRSQSPELARAFRLCLNSFLLQSFLLFVGIYDPNFQRIIFWSFYALALLFLTTAGRVSGWQPTDPASRLLSRAAAKLDAALLPCRTWLRTFVKEGKA